MRSLLQISPDDAASFAAALASGADAVVLDGCGDNVSPTVGASRCVERLAEARRGGAAPRLFVRLRLGDTAVLDAVVPERPDGIVLSASAGAGDVMRLSAMLAAREALAGLDDGAIRIIASPADTPAGLMNLGGYHDASRRLIGLAVMPDELAAALGAAASRTTGGALTDACRLARTQVLLAAKAAGMMAIDGAFPDAEDDAGLEGEAREARAAGFTAKIAIDPSQVPVINRVFGKS